MKEINDSESKTPIEMSVGFEKQEEKKNKLIGTLLPGDGHTLWKINVHTLQLEPIDDDDLIKEIGFNESVNKRLLVKDGYLYCSALNKQNAIKRFGKMFESIYGKDIKVRTPETQEDN
jgi:hypothetical protein